MSQFNRDDINSLATLLKNSAKIVITCHLSPDGDALGSSLGLYNLLSQYNPKARVNVVTPDEPTKTLLFLPGADRVMAFSHYPGRVERAVAEADLLVCLDFNQLKRTDLLAPFLKKCPAKKVLIDHHLEPEFFADITFSYPEKSSTCFLLFEIIESAGLAGFVNKDSANCLLTGMMTDTGDFSYNNSDPAIYPAIGRLIERGADKSRLTRILFNTFSESNLRIQGFALAERMTVFEDGHAALIVLTREDLNKFNYTKGDTEGLVNKPLAIPGILYSCYLREEKDYIKVSMRSLGDFPVNKVCSDHFNGGGHLNAAGGEFFGTMDECVETFKSVLAFNKEKYIVPSKALSRVLADERRR